MLGEVFVAVVVAVEGGDVDGGVVRGARRPDLPPTHASAQDTLEGEPEILTKKSIDERIDGGIAISEPKQDLEEQVIDCTGGTHAAQQVHGEEGQPAQREHAHNHAKCLSRLRLHTESFHLQLDISPTHPRSACGPATSRFGRRWRSSCALLPRESVRHLQLVG